MASDIRVELANCQQVDQVWPIISEGLEKACRRTGGDLTSDYLWSEARAGRAYLLLASDGEPIIAAGVFRFEAWTSGRKLRVLSLYGTRMSEWLPRGLSVVRKMMRVGNADGLVFEGRPGWSRKLRARELRRLFEVTL